MNNHSTTRIGKVQLVGIDEVGRGAWAGPLVVAAVILKQPIAGLKDSKLLTKNRRAELSNLIYKQAHAVSLGWVWPKQIDKLGLTKAIKLAMRGATSRINSEYEQIIIDGAYNFLSDNPKAVTLVRADQTVSAVSAASIIAKVARDAYMVKMAKLYPKYYFERHVGYGTSLHREALKLHGVCKIHRLSYRPVGDMLEVRWQT